MSRILFAKAIKCQYVNRQPIFCSFFVKSCIGVWPFDTMLAERSVCLKLILWLGYGLFLIKFMELINKSNASSVPKTFFLKGILWLLWNYSDICCRFSLFRYILGILWGMYVLDCCGIYAFSQHKLFNGSFEAEWVLFLSRWLLFFSMRWAFEGTNNHFHGLYYKIKSLA